MSKKDFIKITIQDIEIAEEFFENEKHLNEFLINVIRYYRGKTPEIKTKIVQKYFKTYQKTMDYMLAAKSSGKYGSEIKAEAQALKDSTLQGPLKDSLEAKKKEEREKNKKEIEQRKAEFKNSLREYVDKYGKEMLTEFFTYWSEKSPKGRKMRFEKEKVFDPVRRLQTWHSNNKESGKSNFGKPAQKGPTYEAI